MTGGGRVSDRVEWHLTRHFFRAMFDFGILTAAGADSFKHMLLGTAGGFVAFGLLLTRAYAKKYAALMGSASPEPYRRAVLGDDLFIVGLPMLLVAFLTLLVSHALFPDERDFRILGPMPVGRPAIFAAKLAALLLFTGLFIVAIHLTLVPLMLLTSFNSWSEYPVVARVVALGLASLTGSAFTVLAMTAITGVLVLALSGSRLQALTATMRSVMFAALVLCVPLVLHLPALGGSFASGAAWLALVPPAWFVGLQRLLLGSTDPWFTHLTSIAVLSLGTAAAIVAITYVVLFRHFERFMLRSSALVPRWSSAGRTLGLSRGAAPACRGVFRFTTATLSRSQLHQGVLLGLSACGVGLATTRLMWADFAGHLGREGPPSPSLMQAVLWTPFGLMFACGLGVRAALALPLDHRANWIFRLTEDEATRRDQLRAVDRVVTSYVVGLPLAAALPVFAVTLGWDAVTATIVLALIGFLFVHAVLLDWRRIPFTCTYVPGKRFIAQSLMIGFGAFLLFTWAGRALLLAALADTTGAVMIGAALALAAWLLRRRRLAMWRDTPLLFDDEFPDQLLELRL